MAKRTDSVATPICMTILADGDHVHATLSYSAADPLAVAMTFDQRQENGDENTWHFARDLIATVVRERRRAGEADVQVYELSRVHAVIALKSHEGEMSLVVDIRDLAAFLRKTEAVVPTGAEVLDIDAALDELLREAL